MSELEMIAYAEGVPKKDLIEMLHQLLQTGAKYIYLANKKWSWIELKTEYDKLKKEIIENEWEMNAEEFLSTPTP